MEDILHSHDGNQQNTFHMSFLCNLESKTGCGHHSLELEQQWKGEQGPIYMIVVVNMKRRC